MLYSIYDHQWSQTTKLHLRLCVVKVSVRCNVFMRDKLLPVGGQYCSRLISWDQLLANENGVMDLLVFLALFICREETSTGEVRPEREYGKCNSLMVEYLQDMPRKPPWELNQPHAPVVQRVMQGSYCVLNIQLFTRPVRSVR